MACFHGHNPGKHSLFVMTFYTCYHKDGRVIARCQTDQQVNQLRAMGRPIDRVEPLSDEEAVTCRLTDTPAGFNEDI